MITLNLQLFLFIYFLYMLSLQFSHTDSAGALSTGVEKVLPACRQASLIWSISCHVWSNPTEAAGWK